MESRERICCYGVLGATSSTTYQGNRNIAEVFRERYFLIQRVASHFNLAISKNAHGQLTRQSAKIFCAKGNWILDERTWTTTNTREGEEIRSGSGYRRKCCRKLPIVTELHRFVYDNIAPTLVGLPILCFRASLKKRSASKNRFLREDGLVYFRAAKN